MLRKFIGSILGAVVSAVMLGGLLPRVAAQRPPRSAAQRVQAEQLRRNEHIKEEAARRRREHERLRREWKFWEERQRKTTLKGMQVKSHSGSGRAQG